MNEVLQTDVLIVGGGPAGAATAWALARNGVHALVVDRAHFPRSKPCAEYLSPQASRILHEMGALDAIDRAGGAQLSGMSIHAANGVSFKGRFAAAHGFHGFRDRGSSIRRELLDSIVLERARAAGAEVAEGVAVTQLRQDSSGRVTGVEARCDEQPLTIKARLVVGADGLRSIVARRLGLTHYARWPRRIAFVTHFRGVRGISDCGEMHVRRSGYCGLADVGGGVTNVAVVVPQSAAIQARGDAEGFLSRWLAAQDSLAPRFVGAERISPVQVTGPFGSHARRAWASGAALVGDAADFFDPFTGEGIYAALRGGELLGPYLYEALRAPTAARANHALEAYDRSRQHEFGGKWKVERLIGIAVGIPAVLNQCARVLAERSHLADLLIGVAGDFVPPREVLRPGFLLQLLTPMRSRS